MPQHAKASSSHYAVVPAPVSSLTARRTPPKLGVAIGFVDSGAGFATHTQLKPRFGGVFFAMAANEARPAAVNAASSVDAVLGAADPPLAEAIPGSPTPSSATGPLMEDTWSCQTRQTAASPDATTT
jgi:hypothetical protein